MSKKTLSDSLKKSIEIAKNKVVEANANFEIWSQRLTDAQQELIRLESALDALEGRSPQLITTKPVKIPATYPDVKMPVVDAVAVESKRGKGAINFSPSQEPEPELVEFNGQMITLEPGYRVAKNSFGEDSLVPIGLPDLPPMEEPTSVRSPEFSLPAVGSKDGFSDPKDLF